ncbi:hypothetical protein [Cellulosimicrobium protaetiae]|uniref:Uncharacterized protein n=1 Tax=Cellulosimicrobium protaetiae TaxID=2587808 RepID=A0A6M5UC98_9MICO|nr:hypothetical protein [Cellulosimicrobium protaetiae]QJW34815.1 hypothetical protein FIC82_007360 [Cellulosimicrobium protaetiae]
MSTTTSLVDSWAPTGAGGPGWAADVVAETATPSPADDPLREDLDPNDVSPGLVGFVAIFAVALATVGLFFALSRQLRRMRHNAEVQGIGADGPLEPGDGADGEAPGTAGPDAASPGAATGDDGAPDGGTPGSEPGDVPGSAPGSGPARRG